MIVIVVVVRGGTVKVRVDVLEVGLLLCPVKQKQSVRKSIYNYCTQENTYVSGVAYLFGRGCMVETTRTFFSMPRINLSVRR